MKIGYARVSTLDLASHFAVQIPRGATSNEFRHPEGGHGGFNKTDLTRSNYRKGS